VCLDVVDFRLGEPVINEMERAVVESRYTTAVLTPACLSSNFTDFENVIAQHLGLEQSQRRFLGLLREPCMPRLVPQHGNGVSRSREFAYTSQTLDCEAKEVTNARDSGKGQG
jgi:hypothetical protein